MKIENTLKNCFALLPFAFTSVHAAYTSSTSADTLFQEAYEYYEYYEFCYNEASRIHLPTYSEFCYNEALRIHNTNAQTHTPQILTEIELLLTRIKDDQKASTIDLYNAAYLAFWLDLRSLYIQLANILFYRKDFDPKAYKSFVQKTRLIKKQREEARLTH